MSLHKAQVEVGVGFVMCSCVKNSNIFSCLFIGEHQEHRISQFVLSQHPHQLLSCLVDALSVVAVHHEDQTFESEDNMRDEH